MTRKQIRTASKASSKDYIVLVGGYMRSGGYVRRKFTTMEAANRLGAMMDSVTYVYLKPLCLDETTERVAIFEQPK